MRKPVPQNNKGNIRIEFMLDKKRYTFSPGGKYDDPIALANAERIATQLHNDWLTGNFDPTLSKYKPSTVPVPTGRTAKQASEEAEAAWEEIKRRCITVELWDKYVNFKRPSVSPSTIAKDYQKVRNYLLNSPKIGGDRNLIDAIRFCDWLLEQTSPMATKKVITQVSACCNWAIESRLLSTNPFSGMAKQIKLPKSSKDKKTEAFSREEQEAIIDAFKIDKFCSPNDRFKHSYYAPYVQFLFFTGCRPSEVLPLQWKDVSSDFKKIKFDKAFVEGEDGMVLKDGLKTQAERIVPTSKRIQELLSSIKPNNFKPDDLVFPAMKGGNIDHHNFCNRQWKKVLAGLKIPYRKPYAMRHSLITDGLDQGMDAKDVAGLVGNSAEMIYRNYSSQKRGITLPE